MKFEGLVFELWCSDQAELDGRNATVGYEFSIPVLRSHSRNTPTQTHCKHSRLDF